MKKIGRICMFILVLVGTFLLTTKPAKKVNAYTQDAKGNWYWGYQSKLSDTYYDSMDGITDKTAFETALHNIIREQKTAYTYGGGSGETGDMLKYLDEDPNNTNNILCMYTGVSYTKSSINSSWNQEHTWAKSHGFPTKSKKAYRDINHLRATEQTINSSRSNSDFGEVANPTKSDKYGNQWTSSTFEPRDCVKGDIARIMMYMDVRYNGDSYSDGVNLTLVNRGTSTNSSGQGEFGYLNTLLKWHEQDPVDDYERRRNDRAYEKQGNRNPFIDHPEYANVIYGANYVTEDDGKFGVSYSVPAHATFTYKDQTRYDSGTLIQTPNILPQCEEGYVFNGWFTDTTYKTEWNFSTDKITKNITLYAKIDYVGIPLDETFQTLQVANSLAFSYKNVGENIDSRTDIIDTFKKVGLSGAIGDKVDNDFSLAEYANYNKDLFDITVHKNDNTNMYIDESGIRLYPNKGNGSSIDIAILDNKLSISNVEVGCKTQNNLTITIASDGKKATIQNTNPNTSGLQNRADIQEIKITYQSGEAPKKALDDGSLKMLFGVLVSSSFDQSLKAKNGTITVTIDGNEVELKSSMVGNQIYYYGEISININELTKTHTASISLKLDGKTATISENPISVSSLAKQYLTTMSSNAMVKPYVDILSSLQ